MISICLRRLGEKSIVRLLEEGKQTNTGFAGLTLALGYSIRLASPRHCVTVLEWLYMNQLVKHSLETL